MAYDWQRGSQYLSDVLAGLSSGMLSRPQGGPPLAGFGMGLQNANQMLAMRQAQEQQSLRDELLRRQMAQQDKAFAEQEAAKKRAESGLARLLGQPDPRATPKFVGGAGSGPNSFQQPAATGPKPAWLTPDVESILSGMDPNEAFGFAAKLATDKPDTKNLQVSGGMQYDPNHPELGWTAIPGYTAQAAAIAAAGRAPVQPPKPDLITLYGPNGEKPRTFWSTDKRVNDFINQGWSGAKPGADTERKIITLYSPDGKGMKSFYDGNPEIETRLGQGWTGAAPNAPKMPGLITLTKDGQTVTIDENDPQRGMYLGSGWIEAGKEQKPSAPVTLWDPTGQPHSFAGNDPEVQKRMGEGWVNVAPKSPTDPSFVTLVSPTGDSQTLKKGDPKVDELLAQSWVERSGADPNSKPFTEDQSKTAQLLQELLPNGTTGDPGDYQIAMENFDALSVMKDQFAGMAPEKVQGFFTSPEYQRAKNALKHIIANNAYNKSGATITEPELERTVNLLMPQPGESAEAIADKRNRITGFMEGMKTRAGRAATDITIPTIAAAQPSGVALPPPSGSPPIPPSLSDRSGLQWSPSRKQWRDPARNEVFDQNGNLVR